ncbi:hypothetical protein [Corallincola holothuriorum]|nr:hypothetical protein [Corallincola holothuriorum]
MNFSLNDRWLELIHREEMKATLASTADKTAMLLRRDGAYSEDVMDYPLIFPETDFGSLVENVRMVIYSQQKIVNAIYKNAGLGGLDELFPLPGTTLNIIDEAEMDVLNNNIIRADIIPSEGGYKICEINYGTPTTGFEAFNLYHFLSHESGLDFTRKLKAPLSDLADFYKRKMYESGREKLVIFILSKYRYQGYTSVNFMCKYFQKAMPEFKVAVYDETDYPEELLTPEFGSKTLVYRNFLIEDLNEYSEFFKKLVDSDAEISSSLVTERLMDKGWFDILRCEPYQSLLSEQEISAIARVVPQTEIVTQANIDRITGQKDELIFKKRYSCGGQDILLGCDIEKDTLLRCLADSKDNGYVAQRIVDSVKLNLSPRIGGKVEPHDVVLGLYFIGGNANGVFVRVSSRSKVVNVCEGKASSGWAYPLDTWQVHLK